MTIAHRHMPPLAPLNMAEQDLGTAPACKRQANRGQARWRLAVFGPAVLGTAALLYGMYGWLAGSGMAALEWALLAMIGATFVWVTLSVSTVAVALLGRSTQTCSDMVQDRTHGPAMDVALLVPIYNEVPWDVFGNAQAMLDDLSRQQSHHRFTLFVLSDTQTAQTAQQEEEAFARLSATAPDGVRVHYRRRIQNTDKKVGNLVDWITGWGAAHDAMVVLDADSLMTGRAITTLADALSADPEAGLIQSFPALIGARSLFARMQQFSNIAYGWLLAEGLARWAQHEGNYWGHNAIIRTQAFAASAGLPKLRGRKGRRDLILSHDFVEAGLLRRAGWRVRFLPGITGSFEETPATLIDYVIRDRRWCQGNLQHLRLLRTRGLHPVSRFHLFHGAMAYLLSPAWFALLIVWALLGKDTETNVIRYFNETNPLFPDWPPAMSHIDSAIFLVIMYGMLLAPKISSALIIALTPKASRIYGGRRAFLSAVATEIVLSVLYAPVMMIQQTRAVARTALGRRDSWAPQSRGNTRYPTATLVRFHWLETALGILLAAGLLAGLISLWLLPIMISLILAIPLSALSGVIIDRRVPGGLRMDSPISLREPAIFARAKAERHAIKTHLTRPGVPAE